jgi:membrane protein implicated in regulation of membrane protease activity
VGMNQLGLERNIALVFGGVAGIIFGYFYIQIIVIAIIGFIAYALLKKP